MTPRPAQRTTVSVLPRILAAAVLAAACSDSIGPARAPAPPLFSFSAGGIALDQQNSAMGQPGRRIVKGFNPTNPQNGDALVVALFWVGPTNIVDSVTDHLVNNAFTSVGNTYRLVEYVTAGGISMATFVATNVQNIPLANPNGEDVLAVQAMLHDSGPESGIWMSSWRAGENVSAQAIGALVLNAATTSTNQYPTASFTSSCSGMTCSFTSTSSDPDGTIATYTWSFGDGAPLATTPNPSHLYGNAGSYQVSLTVTDNQGATHSTARTVTVPGGTPPGDLTVTTSTSGSSLDPDGYTVTVDGGSPRTIGINASTTYTGLTAGTHTVAISAAARNCTVSGGASHTATVPSGGAATTTFTVTCSATTGDLTAAASTSGSQLDPDGYTVTVDGGSPQSLGINDSTSYTNLAAGSHTVALSGVAANCPVSGGPSPTGSVPPGAS